MAIYSALGTAGILAEALRERNLLRISIILVLLVSSGVIVWRWAKRHPGRGEIGVAIEVAAAYLWTWVRIQVPDLTPQNGCGTVKLIIPHLF